MLPATGMVGLIRKYGELVRFSHTMFALPFAMWSAVLAWQTPLPGGGVAAFSLRQLLGIVLCMVFARSTAMAFNRLVDADFDGRNPRTAGRHIPAGLLGKRQVQLFLLSNAALFVLSCVLFLPNKLPLFLSMPVLLFLCGYSYAKRFTWACHFWLGIALMLAPICAWIAIRGETLVANPSDILAPVLIAVAVLFWVSGFDIIYACQDEEFDRNAGLFSMAAYFGSARALNIATFLHMVMVTVLLVIPWLCPDLSLGAIYYLTCVVIAVLLAYEHSLVKPSDLSKVNIAFFRVNAVISFALFAAGSIDSLLR